MNFRELTGAELREVKRLAADMCANFDRWYGCLLLGGKCYMHYGAVYTCSGLCEYFRRAVLPLNPRLEALFSGGDAAVQVKQCEICGAELFMPGNKAKYCRPCASRVHRRQKNESDRKRRSRTDK